MQDETTVPLVQEAPGNITKAAATKQLPFGNGTADNPACQHFHGKRTIAIVGNGPLSDAQREEIETLDIIVRYAFCMSW